MSTEAEKEYLDWLQLLEELKTPEGKVAALKLFQSEDELHAILQDSVKDMIEDGVSE